MNTWRYISFGSGVQSSALLIGSALEIDGIPRADFAVFADTQNEPRWVYENLARLREFGDRHGIPIYSTTAGDLGKAVIDRINGDRPSCPSIPVFVRGSNGRAASLRRHCTRDYKVRPIERKVREIMGFSRRQRMTDSAVAMIGISVDEASRIKPSGTSWVTNSWPLIDAGWDRNRCVDVVKNAGFPVPKKSACVFCPYHSNRYWRDLKESAPDEFARAAAFDRAIRSMIGAGVSETAFLHRSLVPLDEVDLEDRQGRLMGDLFDEECSGVCGI